MKLNRSEQSQHTYNNFIKAITEMIAKGDINFTIRSLCNSLDLSPRTFYLYFNNKEHAILQCYGYYMDDLVQKVTQLCEETNDPYLQVLYIFNAKMEVSLEAINMGRQLYICALNYYEEYLYSDEIPLYKLVKNALLECKENGPYPLTDDAHTIAWELINFSRGIVFDYLLRNENYDLRTISDIRMRHYFSTFIKGEAFNINSFK